MMEIPAGQTPEMSALPESESAIPPSDDTETQAAVRRQTVEDFAEIFRMVKIEQNQGRRITLCSAGVRLLDTALETSLADLDEADAIILYKSVVLANQGIEGWSPFKELGRLAQKLWNMVDRNKK